MRRCLFLYVAMVLCPVITPLRGQTAAARAAATITSSDLARHINVIAHDSMQGRDTPSRGLELTAAYIAKEFAAAGLKPFGDKNWLQRHRSPPQLDLARSRLIFSAGGSTVAAEFGRAAYLTVAQVSGRSIRTGVLLAAGPRTPASLEQIQRRDKVVLYVPPIASMDQDPISRSAELQLGTGNRGLVILDSQDSAAFVQQLQERWRQPVVDRMFEPLFAEPWVIHMQPHATAGLVELFAAAGLDLAKARSVTTPVVRELPDMQIAFEPQAVPTQERRSTLPTVMGMLEAGDSGYANDFVIFVAHMDHVGMRPGQSDSVANGADDNASGTAGLIALAKAFNQPGVRLRRSILFLAVNSGAKDLWDSRRFAQSLQGIASLGVGGIRVSAVINLDMIGRHRRDTVAVVGLHEVDWPTAPTWIAEAHPELRLTVVDGGTLFRPTSDHFSFAQAWMPSLSLQNGRHGETMALSDAQDQIDTDQTARIVQFAFYLGLELATINRSPSWIMETRQRLREGLRP